MNFLLPVFSLYFLFLSLSLTFCQASGLNHVNVTLSVESGTGDQNTYKTDIDMYPYVSTSPQIWHGLSTFRSSPKRLGSACTTSNNWGSLGSRCFLYDFQCLTLLLKSFGPLLLTVPFQFIEVYLHLFMRCSLLVPTHYFSQVQLNMK